MPISRLLYTSTCNLSDKIEPLQDQVERIAIAAAQRNQKCGITGSLLFVEDQFIQVIEGESDILEDTFERICCDLSHSKIRLIDLIAVKERLFAQWSMALLSAHSETDIPLRDDLVNIRFLVGVNARTAVEQMRECLEFRGFEVAEKAVA